MRRGHPCGADAGGPQPSRGATGPWPALRVAPSALGGGALVEVSRLDFSERRVNQVPPGFTSQGALLTVAFKCFYFRCTFYICLDIHSETRVSPNSIYPDFNI